MKTRKNWQTYTAIQAAAIAAGVVLLVAGLAGCAATQYAVDTSRAAAALEQLDATYEETAEVVRAHIAQFSPEEQQELRHLGARIEALRDSVSSLTSDAGGAAEFLIRADEGRQLYQDARAAYRSGRLLVEGHVDDLTAEERRLLYRFDAAAVELDARIEALTELPDGADITDSVVRAVEVAATAARVAKIVGAAL